MSSSSLVVGKHSPSGPYAALIARCPAIASVLSVLPLLVLMCVYLAAYSPKKDISESNYKVQRHPSLANLELWRSIEHNWEEVQKMTDFVPSIHRLINTSLERHVAFQRIEIRAVLANPQPITSIQLERSPYNILSINKLRVIQRLESEISNLPSYRKLCLTNNVKNFQRNDGKAPQCVPPSSLLSYFFPGQLIGGADMGGTIYFTDDGTGTNYQYPYERNIDRMMANPDVAWYMDSGFSRSNPIAIALRLQLIFAAPITTSGGALINMHDYLSYVHQAAMDILEVLDNVRAQDTSMILSAGGQIFADALLLDSLEHEEIYIIVAMILVAVVVAIRTRQPFTTLCVALMVPVIHWSSLFIFCSAKDDTLPFLAFSSVFFLAGLVVHLALSVIDSFRHSGIMATTGRRNNLTLGQRVSYTLQHAGTTATITIFATILTFLGCVLTPFKGVQDFAILLIIQLALLLYLTWTFFIAMTVANHKYFSRNDRLIQRQKDIIEHMTAEAHRKQRRSSAMKSYLAHLESIAEVGTPLYSINMRQQAEAQKSRKRNVAKSQSASKALTSLRGDISSAFKPIVVRGYRQSAAIPFDEHAFAGAGAGSAYISTRMVPFASIYQCTISPSIIKRDHSSSWPDAATQWRSKGEGRVSITKNEGTELAAIHQNNQKTLSMEMEANGSENPMLTSSDSPTTTGFGQSSPLKRSATNATFAGGLDESSNDRELSHSPTNSNQPYDPQHFAEFIQRWVMYANEADIKVGELSRGGEDPLMFEPNIIMQHPPSQLLPFVACCFYLCNEPTTAVVYGEKSDWVHTVRCNPQTSSGVRIEPISLSHDIRNAFLKVSQRWKERDDKPRRFIIFGKRMNESRAEKDARVLAKVPNARRMSWLENKVAHLFVPFINKARWVTVVISAALIIAFSAISSKGSFQNAGTVRLTQNDVLQRYHDADKYFANTASSCDYCSNYYSPVGRFKTTTYEDINVCGPDELWNGYGPNSYRDQCGQCFMVIPKYPCPSSGMTANGTCMGYWKGEYCESCTGPIGSVCAPDGSIIACDNFRYTIDNTSATPPIRSDCGYCQHSTSSSCINRRTPDLAEDRVAAYVIAHATVDVSVPVTFLQSVCSLVQRTATLRADCPAALMDPSLSFKDAIKAVGLLQDVAFDVNNNFAFMRIQVWVPNAYYSQGNAAVERAIKEYQQVLEDTSLIGLNFFLVSEAWLDVSTAVAVSTAMKFIVFLGLSVTIAAIFAMTLSIRLTLLVMCTVGGTVACTVGVIVLAGWEFNALVLCCFPGIFAVPICHISHMALHYMDRLEENQLQLFAREASTKEAVRTTMSRTLMTVIGACVASAIVCIPTAFSKVYAMYVVAMIMLVSHLWSLLFACVLFPGCLCALGPVTAARHVILAIAAIVVSFIIIAAIIAASNIGVGSGRVF